MQLKNIAVVISTCDKYSFLWDAWYHYFNKNWNLPLKVYFINETKKINFQNINQIHANGNSWSEMLRNGIKQIQEDNIFLLLEDLFIIEPFKENEFEDLYDIFKRINADALRITDDKYLTTHDTNFTNIKKLDQRSRYLISYSPNIWKKSFLLECLKYNQSPWQSEIEGTKKLFDSGRDIYVYKKLDWYCNTCRQGEIATEGKKLINDIK